MTISKGNQAEILAALKAEKYLWVKGPARMQVRRMARRGLVEYSAHVIMNVNNSRSHEELFVSLPTSVNQS